MAYPEEAPSLGIPGFSSAKGKVRLDDLRLPYRLGLSGEISGAREPLMLFSLHPQPQEWECWEEATSKLRSEWLGSGPCGSLKVSTDVCV